MIWQRRFLACLDCEGGVLIVIAWGVGDGSCDLHIRIHVSCLVSRLAQLQFCMRLFFAPAQRRCSACCQRPPKAAAALFSLLPVTTQRCSARVRWSFGEDLRHLQEFYVDRRQRWTTNYLACLDPAALLGLLARLHPATLLSLLSLRHPATLLSLLSLWHQPAQTTIFPAAPLGLLARLHPATLLSLLSLRHQPAQTTIFR